MDHLLAWKSHHSQREHSYRCKRFRLFLHFSASRGLSLWRLSRSCILFKPFGGFWCVVGSNKTLCQMGYFSHRRRKDFAKIWSPKSQPICKIANCQSYAATKRIQTNNLFCFLSNYFGACKLFIISKLKRQHCTDCTWRLLVHRSVDSCWSGSAEWDICATPGDTCTADGP